MPVRLQGLFLERARISLEVYIIFFSVSAKRRFEFKQFQEFFEEEHHQILHPSQTRWLSLYRAVKRVLKQMDALKEYFLRIQPIERLESIDKIVFYLSSPAVFLYLNFLNYILPKIAQLNLLFQRESPSIHEIHFKITSAYKDILHCFINLTMLHRPNVTLSSLDPSLESNHVPVKDIYLGAVLNKMLQQEKYLQNPALIEDFRKRCRGFLIKICQEIKKRFDMNDQLLHMI